MKKILILLLLLLCIKGASNASFYDGTVTYPKYLVILVHGIGGNYANWTDKKYDDIKNIDINNLDNYGSYGGFKKHLEKPVSEGGLGLKGNVYAYNFSAPCGSAINNARELGDRKYHNPTPEMGGLCWLAKAKNDFKNNFKKVVGRDPSSSECPSRYILIVHSLGNYAARGYIYSNNLKGMFKEGFYNYDVDKVVFVDAVLNGSTMAYVPFATAYAIGSYASDQFNNLQNNGLPQFDWSSLKKKSYLETFSEIRSYTKEGLASFAALAAPYIKDQLLGGDLFGPYQFGADISGAFIMVPQLYNSLGGLRIPNTAWGGLPDLLPGEYFGNTARLLNNVEPLPQEYEPTYSIVYGSGMPVFEPYGTAAKEVAQLFSNTRYNYDCAQYIEQGALTNGFDSYDITKHVENDFLGKFLNMGYQKLTLFHPSFYGLPTSQAKLLSLLMARYGAGFYTNDGDGAVNIQSQKGENIKYLSKALRHQKVFKSEKFEKYLNNDFPVIVAGCEVAIAASAAVLAWGGTPYPIAWESFWWYRFGPAASLVVEVYNDKDEINECIEAHSGILKENATLSTALLDSVAIFETVDLQTIASSEVGGSLEASALSFPLGSVVPSGYESIKVKSMTENRSAIGTVNLPVPMTLKALSASGEGERKYVTQMTVTKPPTRIAGKLNYLVPALMKKFEYSFNFAAWKPIENVNPETGEFVLENLPFAEGQNVLAVRAENAVGIKSHQLLKIILNTIPLLASEFSPIPGTYTKNNQPTFKGKFAKAAYSGDPLENVSLTTARLMIGTEEIDVTGQVKTTIGGGTYDKHMWFEFTPDDPLPDGQYTLVVVANSNVGISQAVMDLTIDTTAPTIAMTPLQPYSPRAPATIRWSASDEASPNLTSVRCDLYDSSNNLVTTIATTDSLSKGENFFSWNPAETSIPADGSYKVKIKAFDLAGNSAVAEQPIVIDSTPPTVATVHVEPNPMTSKTTELGLTARSDEKSTVIIKLNNTTNNSTTAYLTQAAPASDGKGGFLAAYSWKYGDMFAKGPEDGIYRVEVIARDEAGNESVPKTLEAVRIDRTPPKIYGQITSPYVLSNIGKNAYQTTLSYNLSDASNVKVKIYNSNTGTLVDTIPAAPAANGANQIAWDGSSSALPKGAYRFQIIAEDDIGNVGTAYASCVKDGIAPEISFPAEDGTEVAGTISIRGTAIDPDWTNDKPFKDYRVYYKKAGADWQSDYIEVPQVNRDPKDPKNISIRPLQNNSTLAYLYTNNLENGDYTIKVEVNEENGETLAASRLIKVNNDSMTASSIQAPYVKLKSIQPLIEFKSDDSVKLPLGFINSVKPANVYVEVTKTGSVETPVYFKYFPNILGAPFIGKPDYKAGTDLGYFIWSDDDGYHLRWSVDGSNHKFTGNIILTSGAGYSDVKTIGGGITVKSPLISWDSSISGGEGGIDFKVAAGQLMISTKTDEDPASPSITADNVYLGISKFSQQYLPIIIDVAGQRLVDVSSMGKAAESSNLERSTQTIDWNGKLDTGAYVDNGSYIVRVRAEGVDGVGVATDEAMVEIKTPFEISNLRADPADRKFSTIGGIDRVSVFYNVSKDSIVTANVFDSSDKYVATIANGKEVLGTTNLNNQLSVVWRGNFPDPDSGTVVTGGTYK
ncbi:MAG: FlgD immunoglobulin-like domain containing protein, partial [Candidatus Margulisiibacteriota bacterium]